MNPQLNIASRFGKQCYHWSLRKSYRIWTYLALEIFIKIKHVSKTLIYFVNPAERNVKWQQFHP